MKGQPWPLPYVILAVIGITLSYMAINSWEFIASVILALVFLRRILTINVLPLALVWIYPLLE